MTNPFMPVGDDPISNYLREHYEAIRSNFMDLVLPDLMFNKPNRMDIPQPSTRPTKEEWRSLFATSGKTGPLYTNAIKMLPVKLTNKLLDAQERTVAKSSDEYQYPFPKHLAKMPEIAYLLLVHAANIEQLFVNVMMPGSTLSHHYGVDNFCFRQHLCLNENPEFTFEIEEYKQKWKEGPDHMFHFRDGDVWHGVTSDPELSNHEPRVVLILDIRKSYYEQVGDREC